MPMLSFRFFAVTCAVLGSLWSAEAVAQPRDVAATHAFGASRAVPDRYIVLFDPAAVQDAGREAAGVVAAAGAGAQLHHVYGAAIKGFAATLPPQAVARLQANPAVQLIEQDQTVSLNEMQQSATWGLDRVDQRSGSLDSLYHYNHTGAGVTAYIIDTGIRSDHTEFTGRVVGGYTAISDGRGTEDCNGHGTHVAGTVGGTRWGVAKNVSLSPVRVLNCRGSGTWSGVIAGVDWVAANAAAPAVANMSLGGGKSASVNAAVAGAVARGVVMVVAAGNSDADACNYSPASEPTAVTVGATTNTDHRASYSNYGACVDLFAPGSGITSAWHTSSSATNTISGTSMASPHVAGVAALLRQARRDASVEQVSAYLTLEATAGVVQAGGAGSPNLLAYSLGAAEASVAQTSLSVGALSGVGVKSGRNWRAQATVPVRDQAGQPVANVTVTGAFVPGGSAQCLTGGSGTCTLTSGSMSMSVAFSKFTVTNLSGTTMTYNADADEFPREIRIDKP
jgi:aqualysin 1